MPIVVHISIVLGFAICPFFNFLLILIFSIHINSVRVLRRTLIHFLNMNGNLQEKKTGNFYFFDWLQLDFSDITLSNHMLFTIDRGPLSSKYHHPKPYQKPDENCKKTKAGMLLVTNLRIVELEWVSS